jgi:hypothetical protein
MKVKARATIPSAAIHAADDLRVLLRAGALPRLGLVEVGMGSRLSFELAVSVTLADLVRFAAWEDAGCEVAADRWHQLGDDLERLHRMSVTLDES